MDRRGARDALLASAQGLLLMLYSLAFSLLLFVLTVVSLALIPLGFGLFSTPVLVEAIRWHANQRRLLADEWAGVTIPVAYRPLSEGRGAAAQVRRCVELLRDPATWRELAWLPVDATAGFVTALFPPALLGYGAYGLVFLAGVWYPIVAATGVYWYAFVPVEGFGTAVLAGAVGAVFCAAALRYNRLLLRGHFLLTAVLISAPRREVLAQRVARLQETRHDALDNSAAELRRIERDLHDGAQARLVAMGMSLGAVEAMIERDPEQAKHLLAQARQNSAEALNELRDLVRGIHPPVLAERGLGDAARALALRTQLPVEVDVELPHRLPEPVETAAYFAVSEVLTNAAKHSGASQVWLDIYYDDHTGTLRMAVTDNGRGGADLNAGTGLRGLERRLGAFDGVLAVSSPAGGPTLVTVEIPTPTA